MFACGMYVRKYIYIYRHIHAHIITTRLVYIHVCMHTYIHAYWSIPRGSCRRREQKYLFNKRTCDLSVHGRTSMHARIHTYVRTCELSVHGRTRTWNTAGLEGSHCHGKSHNQPQEMIFDREFTFMVVALFSTHSRHWIEKAHISHRKSFLSVMVVSGWRIKKWFLTVNSQSQRLSSLHTFLTWLRHSLCKHPCLTEPMRFSTELSSCSSLITDMHGQGREICDT